MRWLFLVHRYLGIALGVLMTMWCISGVVMMYVAYPELAPSARLAGLDRIDWSRCCSIPDGVLSDAGPARRLEVEMLAGDPVLRIASSRERAQLVDLADGRAISRVSPTQALRVAIDYARSRGYWDPPVLEETVNYDQWTVSGAFDGERPLYRFALDDAARTELYVGSATGELVQATTARQRFWNWLGAIPHWLYFAELRRNVEVWSAAVIYFSLAGCFLTAIGLYIGVLQFVRRPAGRFSGYRGILLWHHLPGLIFGLLALTWVASGLLSMNPWGFLDSAVTSRDEQALLGAPPSGAQVSASLRMLKDDTPAGIVSLDSASLFGRLDWIAQGDRGAARRLDAQGSDAPLTPADAMREARALARGARFAGPELLRSGDDYYFIPPGGTIGLPVYRVLVEGGEQRYYLDPVSGALVAKLDRSARAYRWLHDALHRMDFSAAVRTRPLWDVLTLVLLCGVTTVASSGTYLGLRRLARRPVGRQAGI